MAEVYPSIGGVSDAFGSVSRNLGHYLSSKGMTGYGAGSTAAEVVEKWDGNGVTVIVTGCSGGLGLESARCLASKGADVIMAVRDVAKVQRTVKEVNKTLPFLGKFTVMALDLASLDSVRAFVKAFLATGKPLHILLNNAAVMACPFELSADGHEMQFATNHLGHFLLTQLLIDHMLQTAKSSGTVGRVVNVASSAHLMTYPEGIRLNNIDNKEGYGNWTSYGQSKLANILFTREFNQRMKGKPVISVCCHPGAIITNLGRYTEAGVPFIVAFIVKRMLRIFTKSIPQGAATQTFLATAPFVCPGEFYEDVNVAVSSKHSHNRTLGKALWELSLKMTSAGK